MWDRKELKARGKKAFHLNYWPCILMAFLLLFPAGSPNHININWVFSVRSTANYREFFNDIEENYGEIKDADAVYEITSYAVGDEQYTVEPRIDDFEEFEEFYGGLGDDEMLGLMTVFFMLYFGILVVFLTIYLALKIFVFNPMEPGIRRFFVRNAEGKGDLADIALGFSNNYMKNVKTMFFMNLFISLWTLLLVIPGIYKKLQYKMVPYIIAENPEIETKDALELSKQMMDGHKWDTFVLRLSFIGWMALNSLTFGILGLFWYNPYVFATEAELYRVLSGKSVGVASQTTYEDGYYYTSVDTSAKPEADAAEPVKEEDIVVVFDQEGMND